MVNILIWRFYFPVGRLDLSTQVIKSRRMRSAGREACMRDMRSNYRIFVGRTEGKRPLGIPRRRWEE